MYKELLKNETMATTDANDILVSAYDALFALTRSMLPASSS